MELAVMLRAVGSEAADTNSTAIPAKELAIAGGSCVLDASDDLQSPLQFPMLSAPKSIDIKCPRSTYA